MSGFHLPDVSNGPSYPAVRIKVPSRSRMGHLPAVPDTSEVEAG